MVLVCKQTYLPKEENREFRNNSTHKSKLFFHKISRTQWRKEWSLQKSPVKTRYHMQNMKMDLYYTPVTKINSKLFKNLTVRYEVIKFLEEKSRRILLVIGLSNDFFNFSFSLLLFLGGRGNAFLTIISKAHATEVKSTSGTKAN